MDQGTCHIFFALLRSAICGTRLTTAEREAFDPKKISEWIAVSKSHDVAHLMILGLKYNDLLPQNDSSVESLLLSAVFQYEQLNFEYESLCSALAAAQIPFIPLKGAILRQYYREPWMRTSCDIDVLVHREDLDRAVAYLVQQLDYEEKERGAHDVSLFSAQGVHVELHFDLVEENRANHASEILRTVWDNVSLREDSAYRYDMSDEFFYFYHIAHMAKHFENGGCGIRPLIDLWILDHREGIDCAKRDALLDRGGLLRFAEVVRKLSEAWFGKADMDDLSLRLQDFLLHGGVYGSADNRVALQQKKQGGRFGYVWSRIFVSRARLRGYYPILGKYPWLMPIMQVRRWFMLLNPKVARMAREEIKTNALLDRDRADEMSRFLTDVGLL